MMPAAWRYALVRLAGVLGLALLLGLLFGRPAWWLVGVLAAWLAWQFANLYWLQHWLRHRSQEQPPDLAGVFGDLVGLIGGLHRSKLMHKRRVGQLLREFRRLSSALPDGIVLLAAGGEVVWFNRRAAQLLGLRRKVDFGRPLANLLRQPGFTALLQAGAGNTPFLMRSSNGKQQLALHLIRAGEQKLLLVRDVTRETRIEQMRVDFVANASHELRSPLTVVSGYVDALAEDPALAAEWRDPVAAMGQQVARMRDIVEDLLELSQLESTPDEATYQAIAMQPLLQRVVAECIAAAPAPVAEVELVETSAVRLLGSERQVHSIVSNLLSNALKYTPATGRVTLRWRTDGQGGFLSVEDTGPGIPAEQLPRLTERFYRVDRGRARELGGSGLGLAIVKHALQRHGGRLDIRSTEGKGSVFCAQFPAARLQDG